MLCALVVLGVTAGSLSAAETQKPGKGRDFARPSGEDERLDKWRRDEERRRAKRQSKEAKEERKRSKSRFRGQSKQEALDTARREQPVLIETPKHEPLELQAGERVERFHGEFGARINGPDGRLVVDSTLPLRSDVGDGPERLADYELEDRGSLLAPDNPIVATEISKDVRGGLRIGEFGVRLQTASSATAAAVEDRAFFANALPDIDYVVLPTATGAHVSLQVRSAESPEQAVLSLDLPDGAEARLVEEEGAGDQDAGEAATLPRGSVEIVRAGEVIASILAPVAWGADGEALEVSYSLSGSDLVISFPHRSADVQYPLVVDPLVADLFRVDEQGSPTSTSSFVIARSGGEPAAWTYGESAPGFPHTGQRAETYDLNNALWISNLDRNRFYYADRAYGQWTWQAPRQSHIKRADFKNVYFTPTLQPYPAAMCIAEGVYSTATWNWQSGYWIDANPNVANGVSPFIGGPAPNGSCDTKTNNGKAHWIDNPLPGNISVFQLFAYGAGYRYNYSDAALYGAAVYLEDNDVPSVTAATSSPGGWVRSGTVTTRVNATDPGLGVIVHAIDIPIEGSTPTGRRVQFTGACDRGRISRCPAAFEHTFSYDTEDVLPDNPSYPETMGAQRMREGVNTIEGDTYDALYKPTHFNAGTIKVDRSGPTGTISGVSEDELLRDADYPITATSTDSLSGSRSVQITLDYVEKARRDDCPANSNPCSLDWTLDGGDQTLTEGTHTLRAVATDQVGNAKTVATRTFRVDRTAPTLDIEGSLKPEGSDWVAEGEQDLLFDAFDEGGTGVVAAELKIDGQTVEAAPSQTCPQGGCELSHDFYVTTDGYTPGEHQVSVEVTDGAGNTTTAANTPDAEWTIALERDDPEVTLSGSLWDSREMTLQAGATYTLTAEASEPAADADQSGVGALEFAVDSDDVEIYEQPCEAGGCAMSRTFEFVVDEYAEGGHEVTATAVDHAGNEGAQSFSVGNPSPPPATCEPAAAGPPVLPAMPLTPVIAEQLFRTTLPEAFGPSSSVMLLDYEIKPGLEAAGSEFEATGTVPETTYRSTATNAPTIEIDTTTEPACLTSLDGALGASEPMLVDGAAALYANSHPATDTLLRPSGTGSFALHQLRDPTAPTSFTWDVDLSGGRELKALPGGAVAVVEPAEEGTSAPAEIDGLPPEPSRAQRIAALTDTQSQVSQASDDLERAQGDEPDRVLGVIAAPWAQDQLGNPVATSLTHSGSTITMQISHGVGDAYPVVAGHEYVDRDAVDDYETLKAAAEIGDYAWAAERSEPQAGPTPVGQSGPPPSADPVDPPEGEDAEGGGDEDPSADTPIVLGGGGPQASRAPKQVDVPAVKALNVGITANAAGNINSPDFADGKGSDGQPQPPREGRLNPEFVRPFAPWNVELPKEPASCARFKFNQWREFAKSADARDMRVDLAISADTRRGQGGQVEFSSRAYRDGLEAILDKYGRKRDQNGVVTQPGIIDNLMAFNEPQYRGSGRPKKCPDDPTEYTNEGSPLEEKPLLAANLWFQAMAACFPDGPNAESARCGHYNNQGSWEPGYVTAGDYSGYTKPYPLTFKLDGRPQTRDYVVHYRAQLERQAKRMGGPLYQAFMPQVWSFHDYGDFKRFALGKGRAAKSTPILKRFIRLYDADSYKWRDSQGTYHPKVWMTEGGVNYKFNCKSIGGVTAREEFCEDDEKNISLLGMRRQADTMAFLLKTFADRERIKRVYYYHLVNTTAADNGECNPDKPKRDTDPSRTDEPNPYCPLSEFGLLGAADDDSFYLPRSAPDDPNDIVVPKGRGGPNEYSSSKERRYAFCLLRDRDEESLSRPKRLNRKRCPAGPESE